MFGTYKPEDVTVLLKDITNLVQPLDTKTREEKIQSGVHYSEMLPIEYEPSKTYLNAYFDAVERYAALTANAVAVVAEQIWADKGAHTVLVSLARAGTPIAILIKRYILQKYKVSVAHYSISIIRGRGIDRNAMKYILERHKPESIQFVDGWIGKGAIQRELYQAMTDFAGVSAGLAVLSDPAGLAEKTGTRDDFLIASSCLNSTVSGLLSRTFYRADIIGADDFHGAAFYQDLMEKDLTYQFIDRIESEFRFDTNLDCIPQVTENNKMVSAHEEVERIQNDFGIRNINFIKPGIGEATRVLLRRVPWKILVRSLHDDAHLGHLYQLAKEKDVPLVEYPLINYRACGLIQSVADN